MDQLNDFFLKLFDTDGFPKHWYCGTQWTAELGLLHITSDLVIFFSYASIPILLSLFILERKDIPFIPIFWLFAAFITFCGLTHLIEAAIFWQPCYRFLGLMKALTAFISFITAIALTGVIPKALAIPNLVATRALYKVIVESTSDAILTTDLKGTCLSWNRGAEKMFGYAAQEIIGHSISKLGGESYQREIEDALKVIKANGTVILSQSHRYHKSGKLIPVLGTYSRLIDYKGHVIGLCAVIKDLSKKRMLETQLTEKARQLEERNKILKKLNKALQLRNEEMDSFMHVASHDLKSPLRIITNFTSILADKSKNAKNEDEETQYLVSTIHTQAQQMGKFINDLLSYFQVGSEKFEYEEVDCHQLISEIIKVIEIPKNFIIQSKIDTLPIIAPRLPLQIIFQNLITNSIKHHHNPEAGQVEITAQRAKEAIIFRVKDNGPGIPPAYREKIFDIFQTLNPKEQAGGSGIGLSLVKRLLQRYQGAVKVESKLGQGTTFEVIWPLKHT
jgi:PAS domain S-box-containing protein